MSETYTVSVIQYLKPVGHQKRVLTELPIESQANYLDMDKAGYYFEAEMLRTGDISVTISKEGFDLDIEVIPNGPGVQEAMVKMLERRLWESVENENTKQG